MLQRSYRKSSADRIIYEFAKNRKIRNMNCQHPNPQFARKSFLMLDGVWSCRLDPGKSGAERQWEKSRGFETSINVPYCPESKLSGIGNTDFIECMWYHRTINIPSDWKGKEIFLHFGGVDYRCNIFINGRKLPLNKFPAQPLIMGKGVKAVGAVI